MALVDRWQPLRESRKTRRGIIFPDSPLTLRETRDRLFGNQSTVLS